MNIFFALEEARLQGELNKLCFRSDPFLHSPIYPYILKCYIIFLNKICLNQEARLIVICYRYVTVNLMSSKHYEQTVHGI